LSRLYEYCRIEVRPRSWPEVAERVGKDRRRAIAEAGGCLFGIWTGQIGMSSNEGVVMSVWPDEATHSKHAPRVVDPAGEIVSSRAERLVLRARSEDPEPPTGSGIYAHRWFEIRAEDRDEFVELSEAAWPSFEGSHDVNIIGLWETRDADPPTTRLLLLTRYGSLAVWERSRSARTDREREAWKRFLRRHGLTLSTVVATTQLVGS
jgi:hypothetical protein